MKYIFKILMLSFVLSSVLILNGCGTVNGFGHDVSYVGHGISKTATGTK